MQPDLHTVVGEIPSPFSGQEQPTIDQFNVSLDVFQGPFDLLLQLISRKKLDITEVALAEVTDEFIAHMSAFPDLSQTTEFLVVAATLLSIKAAQLLPRNEADEDGTLADLEARDLLFSRLLQYRAFKMAAGALSSRFEQFSCFYPRDAPLEPHFASLLPELIWITTPEALARLAADIFSHTPPTVQVTHLHDPTVPVHQEAEHVIACLKHAQTLSFRDLVNDAATTAAVVSRFLALLELFRREAVLFSQSEALGELMIEWIAGDRDIDIEKDEYDAEMVDRSADGS